MLNRNNQFKLTEKDGRIMVLEETNPDPKKTFSRLVFEKIQGTGKTQKKTSCKGDLKNLYNEIYRLVVRYADKIDIITDYDTDPTVYLKNPYCTVYEWKDMILATDFMVRDEYITENGEFSRKNLLAK